MHLTDTNLKKIANALSNGVSTAIQFANTHLNGQHPMYLSKLQNNNIDKSIKMGKGVRITLSKTQLNKMKKNGGFLQFLLPLLPTLGTALATGALSGLAGWGVGKIADKAMGNGLVNYGQQNGGCFDSPLNSMGNPKYKCAKKKTLQMGEGLYQFGQKK